jgi:transcription elongation factor GreA
MARDTLSTGLQQAFEAADWERVEELWLEALEVEPTPVTMLLELRAQLSKANQKNLAQTLLELLAEALEARGDGPGGLAAISDLVHLSGKKPSPELIQRLERAFSLCYKDRPSLKAVLARYSLPMSRRPLDDLAAMQRWLAHDIGSVVEVQGHGVGRVSDLNLELDNVKVDIGGRRPMSIPFGAVSRYLRLLPEGDFLRRKVEEPEVLRAWVDEQPGPALTDILTSLGGEADVAAIKSTLDGVLPGDQWSSWWNRARKHPRIVTSGTGSRLRYSVSHSEQSATETLLEELAASGARDRLAVARRLAERGETASAEAVNLLAESLASLEAEDPGLAWETAMALRAMPNGAPPAEATMHRVIKAARPLQLLAGISDRTARGEALERLRAEHPDSWIEAWSQWFLHEEAGALLAMIAAELNHYPDALDTALETVFRNHVAHPAQFVWCAETMSTDACPRALRRRISPSLLETLPDTLSRKEFSGQRGRAKALLEGGKIAVRLLLESATAQQAQRFVQRLNRIPGVEPHQLRIIEQAAQQRQTPPPVQHSALLVATKEAIDAKREELRQLLEVEIPKTLKGINAAAAEGDLRENFEYHMLRDRQELQSARAAKLQQELAEVRALEPGAADTTRVNIGTTIHFERTDGSPAAPVTILGSWDADVAGRVFANGSELAEGLLGHAVGDEVEVEGCRARITSIIAWGA